MREEELLRQSEMLCNFLAHFFSGIPSVVLADDCEEAAGGVFFIMFPAVDPGKTLAVVFHDRVRIIAAFDDPQQELLVRVGPVEEPLHAHGLG